MFQAAKTIKISTFWYPETMQFDIYCPQTSKNTDGKPQKALGKVAKQPAKQPAWWQEIKILRARGHLASLLRFPTFAGVPQNHSKSLF